MSIQEPISEARLADILQTADPALSDRPISPDRYWSREFAKQEWDKIWTRTWQIAGVARQLAKAGDYITTTLGPETILCVRGEDGRTRAFYNVCQHRGMLLMSEEQGHARRLVCPYHGWAYNTDGSIRAIPLRNGYDGTRVMQCDAGKGLVSLRNIEIYRGFVFARLADHGPGFKEYFGDSLSSIDNMADRSPEGELEMLWRRACATCTTATGRCSSRTSTTRCTR